MTDLPQSDAPTNVTDPQALLFELTELARKYGVNPDRPFFPVNSLRLFYFFFLDYVCETNEALNVLDSLIPKVEAFLAKVNQERIDSPDLHQQFENLQPLIAEIDTILPGAGEVLQKAAVGPLSSQEFFSTKLFERLAFQQYPAANDAEVLLHIRSLDAEIYASFLLLLTKKYSNRQDHLLLLPNIYFHLHQLYILNDIVDGVVFAQEDQTAFAVTPLSLISKADPEPAIVKGTVILLIQKQLTKAMTLPFPEPLQHQVQLLYQNLANVILVQ
jgi:hypothetical protein